ncbi:hypothetical protein EJ419_05555 [Alloscardovia theropitheci]|uniref:Uncharacterized protein n=1 Tax=Alloscardovia theropitheci TaxID=2496842 RepID=A0A4R0QVC8_9BIFI|nr:hypothetical protein [Alloscardovia theropitheci]TCD54117.1 hypothetical protein EJ419_05555 [Alloscardovia theropitheci]
MTHITQKITTWAISHKILATIAALTTIAVIWGGYFIIQHAYTTPTITIQASAQKKTPPKTTTPHTALMSNTDKLHQKASELSKQWSTTLASKPSPILTDTMADILNMDVAKSAAPMDQVDADLNTAIQEALHYNKPLTDKELEAQLTHLINVSNKYISQMYTGANAVMVTYIEDKISSDPHMINTMKELGGYPQSCLALEDLAKQFNLDTSKKDTPELFNFMSNWYQKYQKQHEQCISDMTIDQQVALQDR